MSELQQYTCHNPICERIRWVSDRNLCPTCEFPGTSNDPKDPDEGLCSKDDCQRPEFDESTGLCAYCYRLWQVFGQQVFDG